MSFLLQIYTGGNWTHSAAFHRTAFVFVCTAAACHQRGNGVASHVRVFRSQLGRANPFYPDVPPSADDPDGAITRCAAAVQDRHSAVKRHPDSLVFPECTLVIDEDPGPVELPVPAAVETVEVEDEMTATDEAEMQEVLDHGKDRSHFDDQFATFKQHVDAEPSQVLRYSKGGKPLWIGPGHEEGTPPPCGLCGKPRVFEFQVMPQLLHELEVDSPGIAESMDWGVLAVFSCEASCESGSDYAEEWVYANVVSADAGDDDEDDDTDTEDEQEVETLAKREPKSLDGAGNAVAPEPDPIDGDNAIEGSSKSKDESVDQRSGEQPGGGGDKPITECAQDGSDVYGSGDEGNTDTSSADKSVVT